jgi:hypothetical protein
MNEAEWNFASREQKNIIAENAQLLRRSAFVRDLPLWRELPDEWKRKLGESQP